MYLSNDFDNYFSAKLYPRVKINLSMTLEYLMTKNDKKMGLCLKTRKRAF